jgi:tetratricopeptide (TPR) repeat protein
MKATTAMEIAGPLTRVPYKTSQRSGPALATLFFILLAMTAAGCGPRIALVKVSPEDIAQANGYVREGNDAFRSGDYYAALIKYLAARKLNPNSAYIHNYTGIAYLRLQFYDRAIEAFKTSMELNKEYPSSVNNMGSAFFAKGDYKKAEKYFKKAIKMKKDDASFHMNLGTLYFEMKKPEKAISEWHASLALDPDVLTRENPLSVSIGGEGISPKDRSYFMARVYAAAGNVPKMIESLQQALLNGFSDIEALRTNPDFDPFRKDERFIKFMESAIAWDKERQ